MYNSSLFDFFSGSDRAKDISNSPGYTPVLSIYTFPKKTNSPTTKKLSCAERPAVDPDFLVIGPFVFFGKVEIDRIGVCSRMFKVCFALS